MGKILSSLLRFQELLEFFPSFETTKLLIDSIDGGITNPGNYITIFAIPQSSSCSSYFSLVYPTVWTGAITSPVKIR